MDDALLVRRLERFGDLPRDRQRFLERNRPARDALGERRRPRRAPSRARVWRPLPRGRRCAAMLGWLSAASDLRLAREPRERSGIGRERGGQHLDGDVAVRAACRGRDRPRPCRPRQSARRCGKPDSCAAREAHARNGPDYTRGFRGVRPSDHNAPHDAHRTRSRCVPVAGAGDDHHLRQPRLDRAAVLPRVPRRFPLRPRPAGIGRRRHGRRLRAGHAQRRARQPALGGRRRPRDGQHLHRVPEPHAARHHRRTAGALDSSLRAVSLRHAGGEASGTVREVELRARPRRRRAGRDRARVSHRDAGAVRTDVRLDSRGRLGSHLGTDRQTHGQPLDASRSGSHRHDRRAARSQRAAGVRRRSRRRSQRRVGSGRRARGAASGARVGQPDVIALQLPGASSAVCRFPAGDPRADRQVPRRSRSHRRLRRAGLHVSHRGLRTAHPAGLRSDSDDRRWRRRRVGAGRHGHRVQRAAWRRGAARAIDSAGAANAARTQRARRRR